jgi:hypothetical protein
VCTVLCSCAVLHAVRSSHRLAQRGAHAACESVIMKRAVVSLRRRDHVMRRRATPTRMAAADRISDRDLHRELRRSIIMAKSNRLIAIGIQSSCSEGATGTCSVTILGTPAMLSSTVCLRIAC